MNILLKIVSEYGEDFVGVYFFDSCFALLEASVSCYIALCLLAGLGGNVDIPAILNFVDSGHDLILAADASPSDVIRDIATECGADFDEVSPSLGNIIIEKITKPH